MARAAFRRRRRCYTRGSVQPEKHSSSAVASSVLTLAGPRGRSHFVSARGVPGALGGMPTPPSLVELSFETLLPNVASLSGEALASLPEHLQISLFEGVLARGMLNEHILDAFHRAARDNDALARRIASLNLRPLPPRPPNARPRWLGDKPSWY